MQLQQDLQTAKAALAEVHPSLYAHMTRSQFQTKAAEIERHLNHPMTALQFFREIAPLMASVRCYHTWLLPSSDDLDRFERDGLVLPLDVVVRHDGVFVRKDAGSGASIPAGTRLVSIGGRAVQAAVSVLLQNYDLGVDGLGMGPRYAKLSRPSYFARVYSLYFGDPAPREVGIVLPGDRRAKTVAITPMNAHELMAKVSPSGPQFKLDLRSDGETAALTISSFAENAEYAAFLKSTFQTLRDRKISNLIIDLRNNGGGEDNYTVLLYSYIASGPFRFYDSLTTRKDTFEAANGDHDFPEEAFRKRMDANADGSFHVRETEYPGLHMETQNALHFDGKIFCLVNGLTGSAASDFSAVARSNHRAVFIGEETGGGYAMETSGPQVHVELPNTKVRMLIPTVRYALAVTGGKTGHNLIPDFEVQPTPSEIASGVDRALVYALEKIGHLSK